MNTSSRFFAATGLLVALSFNSPSNADALLPRIQLPNNYTVVYKVHSEDTEPPEALQNQIANTTYQVRQQAGSYASKSQEQRDLDLQIAYQKKQYSDNLATSGQDYVVTISSDGTRLLCQSRSADGERQTTCIYSSREKVTYLYVDDPEGEHYGVDDGSNLYMDRGFNQSAAFHMPLLWYNQPEMALVFIKDQNQPTGASANNNTWLGTSPRTIGQYALMAAPIYIASQCTTAGTGSAIHVQRCSLYDNGNMVEDWQYSNFAKIDGKIPARIIMNQFETLKIGNNDKWMIYPKTRLTYTLVRAEAEPVDAQEFNIGYWISAGNPTTVHNSAFVKKPNELMVFNYTPGTDLLKEVMLKRESESDAPPARATQTSGLIKPFVVIIGTLLIIGGAWAIRKRQLR